MWVTSLVGTMAVHSALHWVARSGHLKAEELVGCSEHLLAAQTAASMVCKLVKLLE